MKKLSGVNYFIFYFFHHSFLLLFIILIIRGMSDNNYRIYEIVKELIKSSCINKYVTIPFSYQIQCLFVVYSYIIRRSFVCKRINYK